MTSKSKSFWRVLWTIVSYPVRLILVLLRKFLLWVLIHLLNPDDIKASIIRARAAQKADDEDYFNRKLAAKLEEADRVKLLELAEKDAEIEILSRTIRDWEKRENEVSDREYLVKTQVKANAKAALDLFLHIKAIAMFINKEMGEIAGVQTDIETNKKQIEHKVK